MYTDELRSLRRTRDRTIEIARSLTPEQADLRPRNGGWSPGEILDHLLLTEAAYRRYIDELIDRARQGKRPYLSISLTELNVGFPFVPRSLMVLAELPLRLFVAFLPRALMQSLLQNRIIPARNPDVTEPRRGRLLEALIRDLADSYNATEKLLEANSDLDYERMYISHAAIGTNNISDLLRVITLHERRHQTQLQETIASTGPTGRQTITAEDRTH